jgi:hypothetical protein
MIRRIIGTRLLAGLSDVKEVWLDAFARTNAYFAMAMGTPKRDAFEIRGGTNGVVAAFGNKHNDWFYLLK